MADTANPEINVEHMMQRIREEIAQRKVLETAELPPYPHTNISLPRVPEGANCIAQKPQYTLADFYAYHGEDFVRNAYRGILRREPDGAGYARYLHMLYTGHFTKVEILGRLRYSTEGKSRAVPVQGLLRPFILQSFYRIPVIGYGVALAKFLVRLPTIIKNREQFESLALLQQQEQVRHLNRLAAKSEEAFDLMQKTLTARDARVAQYMTKLLKTKTDKVDMAKLAATANRLGDELAQKADVAQVEDLAAQTREKILGLTQAVEDKANKADAAELAAAATRLGEDLAQKAGTVQVEALAAQTREKILGLIQTVETKADADTIQRETGEIQRQILDHKRSILDQQRRLVLLLEEARKRLPEPISTGQIENMVAEEDHLLDAFYVSFEDRFRGTREDIKQRVAIYLPIVKDAKAGTQKAPILDIGCGRGEWLELLQENSLVARGVDLNRVMISQCRELGLEVTEADAIAYLRGLKANSLGAVTGIHIIEHIPFKRLIALFDEVLRVLKPGGLAIFETPNPENLIVGACNFYYDPTHLNPLPPEPMRFVMEARGFGRIEVMRLHPPPESAMLREGAAQVQQIVNSLMFGAQDYALVGYKA